MTIQSFLRPSWSICAAILAGGASARIGHNKALLRLSPESTTLIEIVIARLGKAGFAAPLLITNSPDAYNTLDLPAIPDDISGAGPLGGILTALRHSPYDRVLIVACDMPFLNPSLLAYMASLPPDYDALTPAWIDSSSEQRVEPLHTIYSKTAIPTIERRINERLFKLSDLLGALNTLYLSENEIRKRDPMLLSFRNINTPEDWAHFRSGSNQANPID